MDKKYYLKDIEKYSNIAHFKELRTLTKKDNDGFYFPNTLDFTIISTAAGIIEYYYKDLSLTFSNSEEVISYYLDQYKEYYLKEIEIYNNIVSKLKNDINNNKTIEDFGYTKNKIAEFKFFASINSILCKSIENRNKNRTLNYNTINI